MISNIEVVEFIESLENKHEIVRQQIFALFELYKFVKKENIKKIKFGNFLKECVESKFICKDAIEMYKNRKMVKTK